MAISLKTVFIVGGFLLCAAWALIQFNIQKGIGLEIDARAYAQVSHCLRTQGQLCMADLNDVAPPNVYRRWPPITPVVLAAMQSVFGSFGKGALATNLLAILALLILVSALSETLGAKYPWFPVLLIAFYSPLIRITKNAWSENLFLPLWLLTIWITLRFVKKRSVSSVCLLAVVCAMTYLTRYAGMAAVAAAFCCVAWFSRRDPKQRFLFPGLMAGTVLILVCPWHLRNYLLKAGAAQVGFDAYFGEFTPDKPTPLLAPVYTLVSIFRSLIYDFVAFDWRVLDAAISHDLRSKLFLVIALISIPALIFYFAKRRPKVPAVILQPKNREAWIVLTVFAAIYFLELAASAFLIVDIYWRTLIPLELLILLAGGSCAENLRSTKNRILLGAYLLLQTWATYAYLPLSMVPSLP